MPSRVKHWSQPVLMHLRLGLPHCTVMSPVRAPTSLVWPRNCVPPCRSWISIAGTHCWRLRRVGVKRWRTSSRLMSRVPRGEPPVPVRCTRAELLASMCYLLIRNGFSGNYWVRLRRAALLFRCWCTARMRSCQRHSIMTDFLNTQRGRVLQ